MHGFSIYNKNHASYLRGCMPRPIFPRRKPKIWKDRRNFFQIRIIGRRTFPHKLRFIIKIIIIVVLVGCCGIVDNPFFVLEIVRNFLKKSRFGFPWTTRLFSVEQIVEEMWICGDAVNNGLNSKCINIQKSMYKNNLSTYPHRIVKMWITLSTKV